MIHLRPTFGRVLNAGSAIGDFALRLVAPQMYRISATRDDARLARAAGLPELARISSDIPGDYGIVRDSRFSSFFRLRG